MSDSPSRTVWVTYYAPASSVIRECGNSLLLRVKKESLADHVKREITRQKGGLKEAL